MSSPLTSAHRVLSRLPRRLRFLLTTRPLAYWLATAAVATAATLAVHGALAGAADVRQQFGTLRAVLVATRPLAPGDVLGADNAEVRRLPIAVVADGALPELRAGAVVVAAVPRGEPIQAVRVGRGGDGPVAALLADGTQGIAVPVDDRAELPLRVGDRVDVIAAVVAGARGVQARVVAAAAMVVQAGERSVVVGVAAREAPAVAQALADGGVVLALQRRPVKYTVSRTIPAAIR